MARDDVQQREADYLEAAKTLAQVEIRFSEEFLLAKTQEGITDRMAEHMANVRVGENLGTVRALELIARKRLDAN